jgi:hypothetical protein
MQSTRGDIHRVAVRERLSIATLSCMCSKQRDVLEKRLPRAREACRGSHGSEQEMRETAPTRWYADTWRLGCRALEGCPEGREDHTPGQCQPRPNREAGPG